MKKLKKRADGPTMKDVLYPTYDGDLVVETHGWYEDDDLTDYTAGFTLVHMSDAPDHPAFPKLDRVPPSTFYAFDEDAKRVSHLVSFDMRRTALAWDMDDSGVYFLRCKRALVAPRYVEYCWDSSRALAAGEEWNFHHKDYKGSIRIPHKEPHELIPPRPTQRRQPVAPAPKPLPKKRLSKLPKKDFDATPDHDMIRGDGSVDKAALDAAASDVASKLVSSFGATKKKKKLRKFKK